MSNLFVIAYDDVRTATEVRDKLFQMMKEHLIQLEDAAVVERREDGKIKLHQVSNPVAMGATGGALWGTLIGMLFFVPFLGAAVGAAAGAAGGSVVDTGVNDDFMRELGRNLRPGAAALFLLVQQATEDRVVPEIAQYGGQLVKTSLSETDEQHLREAVKAARGQ
ncbi:DUF1269 domain-containing protein [Streptomyces sp. PTM05]|uniref:DUF1269 domain-containing protein n=1 Tax=Streptantibioticus parmotrematis TaxID=2873249 RepID=A0ABS7QXQ6_9ACTN|nr:DUF1269 domain-containing protein [Streptantibioticus parmotrematis]MBY8887990.1 DUF1269 domain-containing protein [Streptantibioticus parmotrematis]